MPFYLHDVYINSKYLIHSLLINIIKLFSTCFSYLPRIVFGAAGIVSTFSSFRLQVGIIFSFQLGTYCIFCMGCCLF